MKILRDYIVGDILAYDILAGTHIKIDPRGMSMENEIEIGDFISKNI